MTNAEHLIENAITCIENGKDYEFFAKQNVNRELAKNLDWYLESVWQIAEYFVKRCDYCDKKTDWISVEEERPPKFDAFNSVDVMVTNGYEIFKAYYNFISEEWDSYDDIQNLEITHWAFLPELPEVNENDD